MTRPWPLYALGALIIWGIWGVMVKAALDDLTWPTVAVVSQVGYFATVAAVWLAAPPRNVNLRPSMFWSAVALGLATELGVLAFYLAVDRGKASVVVPLTAMYPAVSLVGAVLFLHERISRRQVLGIALALIAAILLSLD
jgi:transporter family protein